MWNRGTRVSDFHRGFRFNDSHYENSFYRALKPTLKIAKLFGLFPIDIDSRNPQNICFKWRSPRTLFSLIFVIGSGLTALSVLKYQINEGPLTPRNIIGVVFFASCSIACVLFFKIAQKFNVFMIKWMTVESCFATHDYELPSTVTSLHKRVLITTILYLLASLLEHLLYFSSETNNLIFALNFCKLTDYNFIELLITKHLNFLFANISYNFLLGLFLEYLNVSYTFFWNFLDLFIILASIGLSFLFEKLNSRVQRCQGLIMSDSVWAEIRCHYIKVHELLRYVNSLMGQMFIFGCFVDGYFILLQLLNITTSLPFFINEFYFWYSLIFLVGRATTTILMASQIQREARYPLEVFRTLPTQGWSEELQRFFDQIKSGANALSGMDFFIVTRKLLFAMAGTLITYELVLLQFNSTEIDKEHLVNCNKTFKL